MATSTSNTFNDDYFYVFRRTGNGWTHEATVTDTTALQGFRGRLAAFGDCVAAAAPWDTYDVPGGGPNAGFHAGSVYVFCRDEEKWTLDGRLRPRDPNQDALFGLDVAAAGDVVASRSVGGYHVAPDSMAVYVHRRMEEGWIQEAKLRPGGLPDQVGSALFGDAVTASTDLVGASLAVVEDGRSWDPVESYWIFTYESGRWSATDTLHVSSEGGAILAGRYLFLGDPEADGPEGKHPGIIRIFERTGRQFVLRDTLTSDRPQSPYPFDEECPFGQLVAAAEDTLVAAHGCEGRYTDSVDVYVHDADRWRRVARSPLNVPDADSSGFRSFAMSGSDLVVGIPNSSAYAAEAGATYVVPLEWIITDTERIAALPRWKIDGPYPNPTRGRAQFRVGHIRVPIKIEVFDLLGRRMRTSNNVRVAGSGRIDLDLTDLPAGIYVVYFTSGAERHMTSVVVAR